MSSHGPPRSCLRRGLAQQQARNRQWAHHTHEAVATGGISGGRLTSGVHGRSFPRIISPSATRTKGSLHPRKGPRWDPGLPAATLHRCSCCCGATCLPAEPDSMGRRLSTERWKRPSSTSGRIRCPSLTAAFVSHLVTHDAAH